MGASPPESPTRHSRMLDSGSRPGGVRGWAREDGVLFPHPQAGSHQLQSLSSPAVLAAPVLRPPPLPQEVRRLPLLPERWAEAPGEPHRQAADPAVTDTFLSALLEPQRHLSWAPGAGAGTPEPRSPPASTGTSQLPDRACGSRSTADGQAGDVRAQERLSSVVLT